MHAHAFVAHKALRCLPVAKASQCSLSTYTAYTPPPTPPQTPTSRIERERGKIRQEPTSNARMEVCGANEKGGGALIVREGV